MKEKIKQETAIKFIQTIKQGVSDLMVFDSVVDSIYSSIEEINKIMNRKFIVTPGIGGIVNTKESYEFIIPESYKEQYSYEEGINSYPWLWFNFTTNAKGSYKVQVAKDGVLCTFNDSVSSIGTLSEDKKTITISASKYLGFEIIKDLNVKENLYGSYELIFTDEEGNDKQIYEIFYSKKSI